jgi:hypothetical protein
MSKTTIDNPKEQAWVDKVVALLDTDKKMQWTIGETLLDGEQFVVPGITGREMHQFKKDARRRQDEDDNAGPVSEKKVGYQTSMKGHDPLDAIIMRTGYDKSSLLDFMRVARVFPADKRVMTLSWSHHQAVAAEGLTDKERKDLLERAENNKYSVNALRHLVRERTTDDIANAGYQQVSFKVPQAIATKLEKLAKKEKRTVANLMEQAVDLLFDEFTEKKSKAA